MRYVLECNWSGHSASQSRCCHREVITRKQAKGFDKIVVIRFGDNTHTSVNVRLAKYREKVVEIKGYSELLWDVLRSGLKGSVHVNDLKKKEVHTGMGWNECNLPEHSYKIGKENKMEKPKTFEHFPDDIKCPVCDTADDGECLLIPIDGTQKERIAQAQPVHLWCAVATGFNKEWGLFYRMV